MIQNRQLRRLKYNTDPRHPARGFTLLEIMIAIFIFAVVLTTIFASYNALFSGNETIEQGTASYEMAKNCLSRMMIDLESIHISLPPEYAPQTVADSHDLYRVVGEMVDIQGREFPKLRFTSLSHIAFGGKTQNGIAEIVYYVQIEGEDRYRLKRADNLHPYPSFEEKAGDPVLCKDLKSLTVKYYDENGTEYDLWDSDAEAFGYSTPRAIRIKLELASASEPLLFETMVTLPVFREKKK
jgi:general secretion pathway protein J